MNMYIYRERERGRERERERVERPGGGSLETRVPRITQMPHHRNNEYLSLSVDLMENSLIMNN